MISPKLKNNAVGYLISGINSSATTINLLTGQGARFPDLADGEYFYATLVRSSDRAVEIVKVTGKTGDAMTAVRAQEGTAALSFSAADMFEMRLTVQTLTDLMGRASEYIDGVTAAALHRSPNAVTAMFVYDTSKDSDGGAWTEKCQHTSWYNEPINGKWLGAHASEAAARSAGGVTGDYFQLSTNGEFFRLNAGSGTTVTFRGNKRDFPRLAAIVGSNRNAPNKWLVIYDLTEPGRPMWAVLSSKWPNAGSDGAPKSVFALNGLITAGDTGGAYGGLFQVDFPKDKIVYRGTGQGTGGFGVFVRERFITNDGARFGTGDPTSYTTYTSGIGIASAAVNAVAMTVLPDAPVDPVTGLKVPTIAVATTGGVSIIQHNGTVSNIGTADVQRGLSFIGKSLYVEGKVVFGYHSWTADDVTKGASAVIKTRSLGRNANISALNAANAVSTAKSVLSVKESPSGLVIARMNRDINGYDAFAHITSTYNTGYMVGDWYTANTKVRRVYLSDTEVGSVGPSVELVTNGTFDTDISGWTDLDGASGRVAWDASGKLSVSDVGGFDGRANYRIGGAELEGQLVKITFTISGSPGRVGVGGSDALNWGRFLNSSFGVGTSTIYVRLGAASPLDNSFGLTLACTSTDTTALFDDVSVRLAVADCSYKNQGIVPYGTLTRSPVAPNTDLVAYEGWSGTDYLQEAAFSSDLDFGTGEWSASAWANIPAVLPPESFPVIGPELVTNGDFSDGATGWTPNLDGGTGWSIGGGVASYYGTGNSNIATSTNIVASGKTYEVRFDIVRGSGVTISTYLVSQAAPGAAVTFANVGVGSYKALLLAPSDGSLILRRQGGTDFDIDNISIKEVEPARIADRAYSSGASLHLGVTPLGNLQATAFDGTTTRTVATSSAYNNATWIKPEAIYTTDGTLAIRVNGQEVAATRGAPLLTLNNSDAVLTIGNSYALDAPFPGKLALVKLSATVPTPEQSVWMYEQEKQLFREGAKCVLPDAGALVDLAYDETTDKWMAASATNISEWSGLVRTNVIPSPAGSYSKLASGGGVVLAGRATTNPGVDVTIPAYNLREELVKRAEDAARMNANLATFDYNGGFTGSTTTGSTAVTSVAGLSYPASYIGAKVTGSGIPVDTVVSGVSGTTIYLSKAATSTATGVQIAFTDFALPVGYEAKRVSVAGAAQQEGATKAFTRLFDGFKETVRFGVAPAHDAWVQIQATRSQV